MYVQVQTAEEEHFLYLVPGHRVWLAYLDLVSLSWTLKNGKHDVFKLVFKAVSAPLTDKELISLIYKERLPINKKKISPAIEKLAKDMNKRQKKKYR